MKYLLDTGILLRLLHTADPLHPVVRDAVEALKNQGHTFCCGMQNVSEFWNVSTRPPTARGGFGLSPKIAAEKLAIIEKAVEIFTDSPASYIEWKRLVVQHAVCGVQVHDTKLVAMMIVQGVRHLLTLNNADFKRFPEVTAVSPQEVLATRTGP